MKWRDKMMHPLRRAYSNVTTRFDHRKSRLLKLQRDVRACDYEDIQIMWEMLQRSECQVAHSALKHKKKNNRKMFECARCASFSFVSS